MKLGGSTIVMGGVWLALTACSGSYEVGFEPTAGSSGKGAKDMGGETSSGGTSGVAGGSVVPIGTGGSSGSMNAGPGGPAPGPDSTCGFSPIVPDTVVTPTATSEQVAARVYGFLEGVAAPERELPAKPSAEWTARLAEEILDAHFDAGTSVPGLEHFLYTFIDPKVELDAEPLTTPGAWSEKLAAPDATLATLLSEPTGEPHRFGMLTEPEVLAQHPGISARGVWMSRKLFCKEVPPPPANIPMLAPPVEGQTKRQALTSQLDNAACVACHQLMDPPAFSLENFDELGEYRELDNGALVDASGTLSEALVGNAPPMTFDSFQHLAPQLAASCAVAQCFSNSVAGFAGVQSDRIVFTEAEANQIANAFADSGFSVRALVEAIVTNRAFLR
jgi:hypothetical protein